MSSGDIFWRFARSLAKEGKPSSSFAGERQQETKALYFSETNARNQSAYERFKRVNCDGMRKKLMRDDAGNVSDTRGILWWLLFESLRLICVVTRITMKSFHNVEPLLAQRSNNIFRHLLVAFATNSLYMRASYMFWDDIGYRSTCLPTCLASLRDAGLQKNRRTEFCR